MRRERNHVHGRYTPIARQALHRDAVLVTTATYADRAMQSIAGPALSKQRGIMTPIVIGYIPAAIGSFNGALVFIEPPEHHT